jgi:Fur family zinc uptake transcriptional regulator
LIALLIALDTNALAKLNRGRQKDDMRRLRTIAAVSANAVLAKAAAILAKRRVKFTEIRRSVLELLCREGKAVSAYDLAAAFEKECGRRVTPNTVYRALEFLEVQGLVAHLASTRAYVARRPVQGAENSLFFVCSKCGVAAERQDPDVERVIRFAARAIGFNARPRAIDVEGICKRCTK